MSHHNKNCGCGDEAARPTPTVLKAIAIPEPNIEEIIDLYDKATQSKGIGDRYRLYKRLSELLPEVKEGNWTVSFTPDEQAPEASIFKPYAVQFTF